MAESQEFEMGRVRGATDALTQQLNGHIRTTDERFIRLESKIDKGFADSQADREAGNKTLGDLIAQLREDVSTNKGGLSVAAFVVSNLVVFAAALLGAKLIFH